MRRARTEAPITASLTLGKYFPRVPRGSAHRRWFAPGCERFSVMDGSHGRLSTPFSNPFLWPLVYTHEAVTVAGAGQPGAGPGAWLGAGPPVTIIPIVGPC